MLEREVCLLVGAPSAYHGRDVPAARESWVMVVGPGGVRPLEVRWRGVSEGVQMT